MMKQVNSLFEWVYQGKSGVGGGIVAIHPGKYVITVWSPKLNKKGNSYKAINFLEKIHL